MVCGLHANTHTLSTPLTNNAFLDKCNILFGFSPSLRTRGYLYYDRAFPSLWGRPGPKAFGLVWRTVHGLTVLLPV